MKRFALIAALLAALLGAPGGAARASERITTEVVYVLKSCASTPARVRPVRAPAHYAPPAEIQGQHPYFRTAIFLRHRALLC